MIFRASASVSLAHDHERAQTLAVRMSMSAIIAKGVSKRYGPTLALDFA